MGMASLFSQWLRDMKSLVQGPTAPEWQSCVSDSELYDSHFLLSGGAKQKQRPYGREELDFFLGRGIL